MVPTYLSYIATLLLVAPTLGIVGLLLTRLSGSYSEKRITAIVSWALGTSLMCSTSVSLFMLVTGAGEISLAQVSLFGHRPLELFVDMLSLPFVMVTTFLSWLVALFSKPYLHRERGHYRFFLLLLSFVSAILLVFTSRDLHGVFIGWEIVGLTSALLIAFFFNDPKTVKNGLTAFLSYRVSDMGLVLALVVAHSLSSDAFSSFGKAPSMIGAGSLLFTFAVLFACCGKGSQYPFVRWLPRAMEGPTPSSAIFYGAISVHAGVYLMLRVLISVEPLPVVSLVMVAIGGCTALYATLLGRIQSDVKSALAYASMAQVGLMFLEMGAGLRWFVVLHFVGHAILRTYQLLHAPAAFQIHEGLERLEMSPLKNPGGVFERCIPVRVQEALYGVALTETTYGPAHSFGSMQLLRLLADEARKLDHAITFFATEGCRKMLIVSSPRRGAAADEQSSFVPTSVNSR